MTGEAAYLNALREALLEMDYEKMKKAAEEGVVLAILPKTPMARMMIEWIGSEEGRFYIHHKKYRDRIDALYQALSKNLEALYEITAKSPADYVWIGENMEGLLEVRRSLKNISSPNMRNAAGSSTAMERRWPSTWTAG